MTGGRFGMTEDRLDVTGHRFAVTGVLQHRSATLLPSCSLAAEQQGSRVAGGQVGNMVAG